MKRINLLILAFFLSASLSSEAASQSIVSERGEFCLEREVLVWGRFKDQRLFRGDGPMIEISRSEPVVWFCGRSRHEFICPSSESVHLLRVIWEKSGKLIFQCFR